MVYVFKKLNDLSGAPTDQAGSVIDGQAAGATKGTHQSTYRNPSAVYNANVGQDMGGLETGVNKNLAETQSSLDKSSADYKSQLQGIDKDYSYQGAQDLQNIGDTGTFSRLSSLVNPTGGQVRLAGVKSNTANYNPDTSGVAQSSNMGGLSAQLKNQYGTSAGGSRLDALLYRGSGQAGKAINEGLGKINQFNQGKQAQLQGETGMLNQLNQGLVDRSNQLKTEGAAYKGQLKAGAEGQAKQAQSAYDTGRQNQLSEMEQYKQSQDYRKQIQDAINASFGDRQIGRKIRGEGATGGLDKAGIAMRLQEQGVDPQSAAQIAATAVADGVVNDRGAWTGQADINMTDYLKQQMLDKFSGGVDLNQFNPAQYQTDARTFDASSYLDPRFNQLGQLLGTEQIAGSTAPSTQLGGDRAGYEKAIQDYLAQQTTAAGNTARSLFDPNLAQGQANDRNIMGEALRGIITSPLYGNATLGLLPGGQKLTQAFNQGLGDIYGGIEDVGSQIGGFFGF